MIKSSNTLGLSPTTWITLAVAVVGIFALQQHPFQDTRPADLWVPTYSHTASEDQDVDARLWQDPLSAVETARKVEATLVAAQTTESAKKTASLEHPPTVPGPADDLFNCEKELKKPPAAGKASRSETPASFHSAAHLCHSIDDRKKAAGSMLVLAAIVSGAPYAADIEDRRRIRYAVLAGLYRSGFMPLNNQHVGYVHLSEFYKDPTRANDLAAFEWFVSNVPGSSARPAQILLLWLDQDGFRTQPIAQYLKIVDGLLPSDVQSVILGPADSDGLRAVAEEYQAFMAKDPKPKLFDAARHLDIYSSRATAADEVIVPGLKSPGRNVAPGDQTETPLRRLQMSNVSIDLYRTIASDSSVAAVILDELNARHIQLRDVALVAERDTLYGRSMGDYFKLAGAGTDGTVGGCANPPRENVSVPVKHERSLPLCLTYLKGLDGIGPPPPKQAAQPGSAVTNEARTSDQPSPADTVPEASTGPRQLDYLRRMGSALLSMQSEPVPADCQPEFPHECERRHIKAIGILGTDVYDKLLVLQELRPMFPDVIFFTFGLDARYTDAENLSWTRELLVGSSLGLALYPELQGDIPAFRDGYQTTTFYSTLLALHRASASTPPAPAAQDHQDHKDHQDPSLKGLQWTTHAMVFEIGRNQPLDLNMGDRTQVACDFDGACASIAASRSASFYDAVTQRTASWLILLIPCYVWLVLCTALGKTAMNRRRGSRYVTFTSLIVVLAIGAAVTLQLWTPWHAVFEALTRGETRMPVPIADGASHWGKEVLEVCLVPLILALLIRGQRQLTVNAERIRGHFGFHKTYRVLVQRYLATVRGSSWDDPEGLRAVVREWLYFPIGHLSSASDQVLQLKNTSALESLIARYLSRGVWSKRWARVLIATVLFILFLEFLEWLGFSLFAGVPWVLAQQTKHGIEGVITFVSFSFMQFLIFWVIDAILLTRAFLLVLQRDKPDWPQDVLRRRARELGVSIDLARCWLDLQLVARRTGWVGGFIWYPSLVIAGMFMATFTFSYGRYHFDTNPITYIASVALIVAAVVVLRRAAEAWRADILLRLEHRRLAALASGTSAGSAVSQVQVLIDLVTRLRDGAFAPYSEQPLVRAVLLPAVTFAATAGFPFLHPG